MVVGGIVVSLIPTLAHRSRGDDDLAASVQIVWSMVQVGSLASRPGPSCGDVPRDVIPSARAGECGSCLPLACRLGPAGQTPSSPGGGLGGREPRSDWRGCFVEMSGRTWKVHPAEITAVRARRWMPCHATSPLVIRIVQRSILAAWRPPRGVTPLPARGKPRQVLSCLPMCLSSVYKEKALGDDDIDVIYLNGWVAVFQFMVSLLFAVPSAYAVGLPVTVSSPTGRPCRRCGLPRRSDAVVMFRYRTPASESHPPPESP